MSYHKMIQKLSDTGGHTDKPVINGPCLRANQNTFCS